MWLQAMMKINIYLGLGKIASVCTDEAKCKYDQDSAEGLVNWTSEMHRTDSKSSLRIF